ncbi:hypothetical protein BpHYR1_003837 [Brachionus plicatilis]|uniref:Transmembrane protein n=1 Tax=Brachionus plicatilis TaxID=10195 RepID=A0A3M7RT42_BRAPC|nr:hypothetical protein BpHYR1_003837 [Brachionus plicatilis]
MNFVNYFLCNDYNQLSSIAPNWIPISIIDVIVILRLIFFLQKLICQISILAWSKFDFVVKKKTEAFGSQNLGQKPRQCLTEKK